MPVSKECQLPDAEVPIDAVDLRRLDSGVECVRVFLAAVYPIRPDVSASTLMTSDFRGDRDCRAPMRWMNASRHAHREQELTATPPVGVLGIGPDALEPLAA